MPLLIRLLALLALLWTGKQVLKHVSSVLTPHREDQQSSQGGDMGDDMVKDPVCQTYIPKSIAVQKTLHGKNVYFCSEECASKFIEQQSEG